MEMLSSSSVHPFLNPSIKLYASFNELLLLPLGLPLIRSCLLYTSIGSVDVVAAARSVLQMEHDPGNKDIRIVRQIKNNLAPSDGEIRFSITAEEGFRWLECKIPTDPEAESEPPKFESKSEKAAYLIKKLLSEGLSLIHI